MQGMHIICLLIALSTTTFANGALRLESPEETAYKYAESALDYLQHKILTEELRELKTILATRSGCWPHEALCKRSGKTAHMELFDYVTKPKLAALYVGPSAVKPQNSEKSAIWKELLYN